MNGEEQSVLRPDVSLRGEVVVELRGLAKAYGSFTAVHPIDIEMHRGEFVAILGPSGCGKSTLLKLIGGFIEPTAGSILIGGRDLTRVGPEHRPTNMVFQSYGLFPHMTVAQNVAYGLRLKKTPREETARRVAEALRLVSLEGFGERQITMLSGGQQQRVALARALVMRPAVLLLDEPLSALDLKLRRGMQEELRRIHRTVGGTFVFVTHDQEEAMGLASRILVMDKGRIVQDGTAEEIYTQPRTRFVSDFIGEANILRGQRRAGAVFVEGAGTFPGPGPDGDVSVVVRPESVAIDRRGGRPALDDEVLLDGVVADVVFLGATTRYAVEIGEGLSLNVARPESEASGIKPGDAVSLRWKRDRQRVVTED